jgi:TonB family protein
VYRLLSLALLLAGIACHGDHPREGEITPAVRIPGKTEIPYPPELFARRIEGQVMLYLFVDSTGAIVNDSTRIAKSSGQAAFDAAALEAAPHLRFTPAHRGAVPVAAPIQVPIIFTLPDSISKAK